MCPPYTEVIYADLLKVNSSDFGVLMPLLLSCCVFPRAGAVGFCCLNSPYSVATPCVLYPLQSLLPFLYGLLFFLHFVIVVIELSCDWCFLKSRSGKLLILYRLLCPQKLPPYVCVFASCYLYPFSL